MLIKVILFALLYPSLAFPWEETVVLEFIARTNPIIIIQRDVAKEFEEPDTTTWMLRNTYLNGRLGLGGTEFRDNPVTLYGGLQFNIPLSSLSEKREAALKQLALTKGIDTITSKVLKEIATLRGHEADIKAAEVRVDFLKSKAQWIREKLKTTTTVDDLWTTGDKLNKELAAVDRLNILTKTQRHRLSRYAGEHWQSLFDYLEGKTELP